eukprot:scaffold1035_cov374-Prasinococcus_capsulatus_cf.AAC.5
MLLASNDALLSMSRPTLGCSTACLTAPVPPARATAVQDDARLPSAPRRPISLVPALLEGRKLPRDGWTALVGRTEVPMLRYWWRVTRNAVAEYAPDQGVKGVRDGIRPESPSKGASPSRDISSECDAAAATSSSPYRGTSWEATARRSLSRLQRLAKRKAWGADRTGRATMRPVFWMQCRAPVSPSVTLAATILTIADLSRRGVRDASKRRTTVAVNLFDASSHCRGLQASTQEYSPRPS